MKFKYAVITILLTVMLPCLSFAQEKRVLMGEKIEKLRDSATEWKHMYFAGISKHPINRINLNENEMNKLFSVINIKAVISSGTAIEPQYLINKKGVTPWLAMYVFVRENDREALDLVANGQIRIDVPSGFIRGAFGSHINWPTKILEKYNTFLGSYHVFVIPFIVHKSVSQIGSFPQPMKIGDGSLEIFDVYEFTEEDPEGLLKEFSDLTSFIKENRLDITQE